MPTHGNSVFNYQRDALGRVTSESTSFNASNSTVISNEITSRGYDYDVLGNVTNIYSKDVNGNIKNSVRRDHNAFGQITFERQDHGDGRTANYRYQFENVNGGVRATGIEYQSAGRTISYDYTNAIDNSISRISSVKEGGNTLESYKYLGLGSVNQVTTSTGGGNVVQNRSFDNFGRLGNQTWAKGSFSLNNFTYTYDTVGNLVSKRDNVYSTRSELFQNDGASLDSAYDALGRMQFFQRGVLHANGQSVVSSSPYLQDFDADTDGLHRSVESGSHSLQKQNNIRPLFQGDYSASTLEPVIEGWAQNNGITSSPSRGATSVQFDPWGHVVQRENWEVTDALFDKFNPDRTSYHDYLYDGTGRMISRTYFGTEYLASHFFHDTSGNILEEHVRNVQTATESTRKVSVWSPVTNELILEDQTDNGVTQRFFTLVDGRGNTVSVLNSSGNVVAAYAYSPSGKVELLSGSEVGPRFLYQQGWQDVSVSEEFDATILRNGMYFDSLTGSSLQISPSQYWGQVTKIEAEPLTLYQQTALIGVPVVAAVTVGFATGGLGFFASGAIAGATGGIIGGAANAAAADGSVYEIAQGAAFHGTIGAVAGGLGGAAAGRFLGNGAAAASGRAATLSQAVRQGLGTEVLRGAIDGSISGAIEEGARAGYNGQDVFVASLRGAAIGGGIGAVTGGVLHSASQAVSFKFAGHRPTVDVKGENCFVAGTQVHVPLIADIQAARDLAATNKDSNFDRRKAAFVAIALGVGGMTAYLAKSKSSISRKRKPKQIGMEYDYQPLAID
jgi:hypothetical protein